MSEDFYIIFTARVNKDTINKLREEIIFAQSNNFGKINILISSGGGDIIEGLNISYIIRAISIPRFRNEVQFLKKGIG